MIWNLAANQSWNCNSIWNSSNFHRHDFFYRQTEFEFLLRQWFYSFVICIAFSKEYLYKRFVVCPRSIKQNQIKIFQIIYTAPVKKCRIFFLLHRTHTNKWAREPASDSSADRPSWKIYNIIIRMALAMFVSFVRLINYWCANVMNCV